MTQNKSADWTMIALWVLLAIIIWPAGMMRLTLAFLVCLACSIRLILRLSRDMQAAGCMKNPNQPEEHQ